MNDAKPLPNRRSVIGTSFQGRPLVIYPIFINPTCAGLNWAAKNRGKNRQSALGTKKHKNSYSRRITASSNKETCDVRQSNFDTALRCIARCCGRGFGDSARSHGDRSRVRAAARFPGSQTGRYQRPSAHGKDAAVEAYAEVALD
jgi:hypothetical protein